MPKRKVGRPASYRFGDLSKPGKRINLRTKRPYRVRNAAYMYARNHGWQITTRLTPQGVSCMQGAYACFLALYHGAKSITPDRRDAACSPVSCRSREPHTTDLRPQR